MRTLKDCKEFEEEYPEELTERESEDYEFKRFDDEEKDLVSLDDLEEGIYLEKDVKEFIKLLKDDFKMDTFWQKVCERIDKRAGVF